VPEAATEKVAVAPAVTVWLAGWVVMVGAVAVEETVRVALVAVALPAAVVPPARKVAPVAPGGLPVGRATVAFGSPSVGRSGLGHSFTISDPHVIDSLNLMRKRRGGSARLLAYRGEARWADLDASAVNAYISQMVHEDLTAKDFRTWHATVLAAVALAESPEKGDTKASQKRAVKAAVEEVAAYLGNTPTIARKSYVDPRVIDQYESGVTIAPTLA